MFLLNNSVVVIWLFTNHITTTTRSIIISYFSRMARKYIFMNKNSYFSYCQLYKNCYMLDAVSCHDCLSGEKECLSPEMKCDMTGSCYGIPFARTNMSKNPDECLELCKVDTICKWFTFESTNQTCNLFRECNSLVGCDTCTSGNSKCGTTERGILNLSLQNILKLETKGFS